MKQFLTDIISALILTFIAYWLLPWWGLGMAGFLFALLRYRTSIRGVLIAGFLSGFICWIAFAGYFNQMNEGILADRIGTLFGGLSAAVIVLLTAFLGGLTTFLGSWAGLAVKNAVRDYRARE